MAKAPPRAKQRPLQKPRKSDLKDSEGNDIVYHVWYAHDDAAKPEDRTWQDFYWRVALPAGKRTPANRIRVADTNGVVTDVDPGSLQFLFDKMPKGTPVVVFDETTFLVKRRGKEGFGLILSGINSEA